MWTIILGFIIPLIGTTIGSSIVFLLKNEINKQIESLLQGIAAGVMIAASIWSLLIPSLELSSNYGAISFLPAVIGFIVGMLTLMLLDMINENKKNKKDMLNFAVLIHNIPEGLSVGIAFAAALSGNAFITASALTLSIGIGIQNIPEGSIISLNMIPNHTKSKAFFSGFLSGVVEPISSIFSFFLIYFVSPLMPYLLAYAAGAMIYVVIDELIPNSYGKLLNVGFIFGFVIMMILDVLLS